MITPEKIEEWIKEVEERPASAPLIIQYIANRLRDLSSRNEALLSENIALLTGKQVEEYEKRISYLEYQLGLLKRQLGGELDAQQAEAAAQALQAAGQPATDLPSETNSILIYDALGRVLRMEVSPAQLTSGSLLAQLHGDFYTAEPPRLLTIPSKEELLFIFTTGRVAAMPASSLNPTPFAEDAVPIHWEQIPIPDEPRGIEALACIAPVSTLALADFFVQTSRRGYVKKIAISLAQSILANRYIGTGVKLPADQTFELALCRKDDRLVLVSQEGYLVCLEVRSLPPAIDEVMHLGKTDHLAAAYVHPAGCSLLVVTQLGKVIHRTEDRLEVASSFKSRGQAVFSQARREQGARVVGAAAVDESGWGVALHQDGRLTLHAMRDLFGSGSLPTQSEIIAFAAF